MTTSEPATSDIRFAVEGYDRTHSATLGLGAVPGAETVTVFAPAVDTDNAYNHGAVLTVFRGRYLVQWQSSARDEDADDTRVMMATSTDGRTWTAPRVLVGPRSGAVVTNGGWLSDGETLTAFVNVWPEAPAGPRQGFTEALTSRDGDDWTAPVPVRNASGAPVAGIIEQDPRPLPDGRILTAFHLQPGLVATPHYTTDPLGLTGWTAARFENLPTDGPVSRELEPSWYLAQDGAVVMVFRDQAGTFSTLVSESGDLGRSWSRPALAAFPDSRSKQSAGNLPDGTAFRVNTPRRDARRYPLVLSLSEDGRLFDRAFALRTGLADLPPMRFDGRYKRLGYSYPKSLVHDGWLYVAYATNKERIEITRVPLDSLAGKGEAVSPAPR
jgi:hypothetical protein